MNHPKDYSVEIIRYHIPADQHDSFERAYAEAGIHLQASPVCLAYELIHGEEEPDHYIVRIHWTSSHAHMNEFRKSSEFQEFFKFVKPFYTHIQEMKHYHLTPIAWQSADR